MATIYLRSTDGNDADNGSTWALAKATLAAAVTAAGVGGTVYMSQVHSELVAAQIVINAGTATSPRKIICVNDSAEPPTATATTGIVATSGSNNIVFNGFCYVYGVTFRSSDSTFNGAFSFDSVNPWWWRLENCHLEFPGTGAGSQIRVGARSLSTNDQLLELVNTTVKFGNATQYFVLKSKLKWCGGSVDSAGTAPTSLFAGNSDGNAGVAEIRGVDLSALGSGSYLLDHGSTTNGNLHYFDSCKLGASVGLSTGTIAGQGGHFIRLTNCDSGDTNYAYALQCYQGDINHEATIVRTGGASDGTTGISRKLATTANSKFYSPLELGPLVAWNESTSSLTVTVHVVTDNVTLTDAECWIEVEELGTSGYPLSVIRSDRAADILATPANQSTSTEAWTTTGLTTPVYQKLNVTFTPAEKGPIKVRVMLAKASTTVYVCPKVEVS